MKGTIFFLVEGQSFSENLERFHSFCDAERPAKYETIDVNARYAFK